MPVKISVKPEAAKSLDSGIMLKIKSRIVNRSHRAGRGRLPLKGFPKTNKFKGEAAATALLRPPPHVP